MTTRRPNLKLMETAMTAAELPATRPILIESSTQRIDWQREIKNIQSEQELIDEQIKSAERICEMIKSEAVNLRDARINHANEIMDREYADADKIRNASVAALQRRREDLDRVSSGLSAAVNASGESKPDGV